ncbi:unnamed protein product, partial [Mycena citricolor]
MSGRILGRQILCANVHSMHRNQILTHSRVVRLWVMINLPSFWRLQGRATSENHLNTRKLLLQRLVFFLKLSNALPRCRFRILIRLGGPASSGLHRPHLHINARNPGIPF